MARRVNGDGTIYRRKDGRYEGAAYFLTASGKRKRLRVYGRTRDEVSAKLTEVRARAHQGIPLPDRAWTLAQYLDYWLENIVRANRRPATYEQYEWNVRLYLKPGLGSRQLTRLSVPMVQAFLNDKITEGHSVRKVHIMRMVLSSALGRAWREELVGRNVARLVELPTYQRDEITPWSAEEAKRFLRAAQGDPLYAGFALLLLCGLRRGEVLGLRWSDIDFAGGTIHVRQQLQRVGRQLYLGPVKTQAGQRLLPLPSLVRDALGMQRLRQQAARVNAGTSWRGSAGPDQLVFATASGLPIEPRNFVRSFQRICIQHGIRLIKVHHVRHTTATLLKNLKVPARDTQLILGHSHISITQQIYQHDDLDSRKLALEQVERIFLRQPGRLWPSDTNRERCRQTQPSTPSFVVDTTSFIFGSEGVPSLVELR